MQRNNCLVLNNSLHLYPSSLRRRAEPTLGSVRKGEKLSGMGRAGGSSRTPPLPTLPQVRSLSGFAMGHMGCSWSGWCPAGASRSQCVLLPGVIPPQGKVYSSPLYLSGVPAGPFLQVSQNGATATQPIKHFHISCVLRGSLCAIPLLSGTTLTPGLSSVLPTSHWCPLHHLWELTAPTPSPHSHRRGPTCPICWTPSRGRFLFSLL